MAVINTVEPIGVQKAGNVGLVTMILAATSYPLHTMPTSMPTTAKIRKIMWYNGVGADSLLQIGYTSLAAAFVQTIPNILCLAGFDGELTEADLPNYEFRPDTTAGTGTLGDIIAQVTVCPAGAITVIIEVEEFRQ